MEDDIVLTLHDKSETSHYHLNPNNEGVFSYSTFYSSGDSYILILTKKKNIYNIELVKEKLEANSFEAPKVTGGYGVGWLKDVTFLSQNYAISHNGLFEIGPDTDKKGFILPHKTPVYSHIYTPFDVEEAVKTKFKFESYTFLKTRDQNQKPMIVYTKRIDKVMRASDFTPWLYFSSDFHLCEVNDKLFVTNHNTLCVFEDNIIPTLSLWSKKFPETIKRIEKSKVKDVLVNVILINQDIYQLRLTGWSKSEPKDTGLSLIFDTS